jgi:hypothetical protein
MSTTWTTSHSSVSDRYFYEELLLAAGPEVSYEWLTLHSKRTSNYRKDVHQQHVKMPSPSSRLESPGFKIRVDYVEKIENHSISSSSSINSTKDATWGEGIECPSVSHSTKDESASCTGDASTRTSSAEAPSILLHGRNSHRSRLQHSESAPELHQSDRDLLGVHLSKSCNAANMGLLFTDAAHTLLE